MKGAACKGRRHAKEERLEVATFLILQSASILSLLQCMHSLERSQIADDLEGSILRPSLPSSPPLRFSSLVATFALSHPPIQPSTLQLIPTPMSVPPSPSAAGRPLTPSKRD